jgi:hypothetical protein
MSVHVSVKNQSIRSTNRDVITGPKYSLMATGRELC